MTPSAYNESLRQVLTSFTTEVKAQLTTLKVAADTQGDIVGVVIEVFIDQDAEGPFDVWARFEGRDVFALNQRLADVRHLFGVVWGEEGWEPDVPARPHNVTPADFEMAVLAEVTEWLTPILPAAGNGEFWWIGTVEGRTA